jgi:D-sedoheptulose 7-phosphate isomerase
MAVSAAETVSSVEEALLLRNQVFHEYFSREATHIAAACREMAERFLRGGRLLAFGRGPYATDAQHVSVEFVHPVIVGKRALPAIDLSLSFWSWVEVIAQPDDMLMGFGPPTGDPHVEAALRYGRECGAMTFALPGHHGSYAFESGSRDPFIHQELQEVLYHTLWETVHVYFEHRELGHDVGDAGFLYPFLGSTQHGADNLLPQVADSILMKVADDARLREQAASNELDSITAAIASINQRLQRGGKLILFGNGGSATDANDWAIDCVSPPVGLKPVPAISLALEPAIITAVANDVGADVIFLRQLIAQARPNDAVVAISTSGGSRNVIAALEEARKRKLLTVALLGYDGGEIQRNGLADVCIVVSSDYIPRIQEIQASIYHIIRDRLDPGS